MGKRERGSAVFMCGIGCSNISPAHPVLQARGHLGPRHGVSIAS